VDELKMSVGTSSLQLRLKNAAEIQNACRMIEKVLGVKAVVSSEAGGITAPMAVAAVLVIACAWAMSWIFAFFGVIARIASSVQGISLLILFPLTFLSTAFVPVNTMPHWLQWFVHINPLSHLVSAVRELADSGTIGSNLGISLIGAAVVVLVFAPLTVRNYMRRA